MSSPSRNVLDRIAAVRLANLVLEELDGRSLTTLTGADVKSERKLVEALEELTRTQTTVELVNFLEELAAKRARQDEPSFALGLGSGPGDTPYPFRDDGSRR